MGGGRVSVGMGGTDVLVGGMLVGGTLVGGTSVGGSLVGGTAVGGKGVTLGVRVGSGVGVGRSRVSETRFSA